MPRFVATGFFYHQTLPGYGHDFNRRIPKTVRPVVWEGAGAQSPVLDPIAKTPSRGAAPPPFGGGRTDPRRDAFRKTFPSIVATTRLTATQACKEDLLSFALPKKRVQREVEYRKMDRLRTDQHPVKRFQYCSEWTSDYSLRSEFCSHCS